MQSIKEILKAKNEIAYKNKVGKSAYVPPVPNEYYTLKDKVNSFTNDTKYLIESADPEQIDSHDPSHLIINLDGHNNKHINNIRYLIQLVVYLSGETVVRSHIVGMLANYEKCYLRDLVTSEPGSTKELTYRDAKRIMES